MEISWKGEGVNQQGVWVNNSNSSLTLPVIQVDRRYYRPTEVETLLGDPSKAKAKLGWTPKTSFQELVAEMVREDLKLAERDKLIISHGHKSMDYHE